MRKLIIPFSCSLLLMACSKEIPVKTDFPGMDKYAMIYMPQAQGGPAAKAVTIGDTPDTVSVNAFLGGIHRAAGNIAVTFSVTPEAVAAYNQANGTSYPVMPEGSYTLATAEANIPAGQSSSGPQNIILHTKGRIDPFITYMLPVTLTQPGKTTPVNPALSTAYFLVTGGYQPGEVPREKVASLGTAPGSLLFSFGGRFIRKAPDGTLQLYTADAQTGHFTAAPAQIGAGWNIFNKIFFYGGDRLIARYAAGGGDIAQYPINSNGQIGGGKTVGFGWGGLQHIVPYKGLLLGIDGTGKMTKFPLDASGNFDYGNIKQIGSGWTDFTNIFPYKNSLIALDKDGKMYQYPLSDDGIFGSRTLVGSGWDMYTHVMTAGTDLLALDANGDLWRYKFNPAGMWALKKP